MNNQTIKTTILLGIAYICLTNNNLLNQNQAQETISNTSNDKTINSIVKVTPKPGELDDKGRYPDKSPEKRISNLYV